MRTSSLAPVLPEITVGPDTPHRTQGEPMSEHERPNFPFSDLHREGDSVIATLLHDPTVEGLDMALYLDGSKSMDEEYTYKSGGFFAWLFGKNTRKDNVVEPQARWILEYLATKDRNGLLRAAYWACGSGGKDIEVIGEMEGKDVASYAFPGPGNPGGGTRLLPAIDDFVTYMRAQVKTGAERGCAVFITDGVIHDAAKVDARCGEIVAEINQGTLPKLNFVLVGVGTDVDEEQMEEICHEEYEGIGHLWCHRVATEIENTAELVAVLVDETMTVAGGGTVYDDNGAVLKRYEGRLPAVLEFDVPETARSFTLEIGSKRYQQAIPEEEDH